VKWKSSENRPSELNGFLDAGSELQGELRFETSFRVDGRFTGTVVSEGDLMVGAGGEIEGEIRVGRVFVSGTIRGNIEARQRVQIASGGKVFADLATPSLVIEDGGMFEGRCAMAPEERAMEGVAAGAGLPKLVAQKVTAF
jgi:cytoskeletal protein CcmA (bactofilin family)